MKRVFDVTVASVLIVLTLPVMAIVALLIRLNLGKPILFKQQRPGYKGRIFTIYKFRTMLDLYGDDGRLLSDEERLTTFGKWVRRLSLDELPQLFNIVRGELSLVGPRPLLVEYLPLYSPEQMRRHDVLPGITGWAQVNGRNDTTWGERLAHDCWYVDHRSFRLDLYILWLTFWVVVRREGISQRGRATMETFLEQQSGKSGR